MSVSELKTHAQHSMAVCMSCWHFILPMNFAPFAVFTGVNNRRGFPRCANCSTKSGNFSSTFQCVCVCLWFFSGRALSSKWESPVKCLRMEMKTSPGAWFMHLSNGLPPRCGPPHKAGIIVTVVGNLRYYVYLKSALNFRYWISQTRQFTVRWFPARYLIDILWKLLWHGRTFCLISFFTFPSPPFLVFLVNSTFLALLFLAYFLGLL